MKLRSLHNWAVGIWFIYEIFIREMLPKNIVEVSNLVSPLWESILLCVGFYYLLFNQTEKKVKSIEEITTRDNLGNYLKVFFIMFIIHLKYLHPIVTWIKIGLYGICLLLILVVLIKILVVLIKEWSTKKEILSGVIVGHLILGYIIFNWSKNTYVGHYGNEIIGSYWAKPSFTTKYIVKLSKARDSNKEYALPGIVTVFSEWIESDYPQENEWGQEYYESYIEEEYILLEKVFFNNGGYLTFEECDLEMGVKIYCTDQNDEDWYIELTKEKVK